ncbi:LuxR C-terminal-related transcriptional regulator [Parablautia intestinalis]|uniref:LuxR C-terminal-related transcriptional regulator n=1 Tax=Parablautia intestinalis TaxID=2320100 RepID=UPI00256F064D|nr:LuxR C-terminal-related transcriptional regulator [Parablautia intestinalis]
MELTKEQLAGWRRQGLSNVKIAEMTGKSLGTVNMLFSRYRIPKRSRAVPEEKREAIIGMKEKGLSTKEIAGELGLAKCTVNNYIKEAGLRPEKEDTGLPEVLVMAVPRVPKPIRTEICGHKYWDVTDFFIRG